MVKAKFLLMKFKFEIENGADKSPLHLLLERQIIIKELFPDQKIQEKWISITLRGRTCIVLLKKDSNHKFDYKQECIFDF